MRTHTRLRILSKLLIATCALVWVPYFLIKNALEPGLSIQPFLIIHLSGILGGILVRLNLIGKLIQRPPCPMIRVKNPW
ncbi:MAG: hypothetical protein ABUK16_11755 [Anaerolineales bacterium]